LASPRLLASGHHSASPVAWLMYPGCALHLPGASTGVPTQGTSHWGQPLGESNASTSTCCLEDVCLLMMHFRRCISTRIE
jgi:hypothetical protein